MKTMDCSCIIPFHNEALRSLYVVKSVQKVKGIEKIITVDDGSSDNAAFLQLNNKFPHVISIRLDKNIGKPMAIKEGLKYVDTEYVLLLDGDLTNIKPYELENAIQKIVNNPHIDMIILRRSADETSMAWMRQDIVTSGQRILRKSDLEHIYASYPSGFQLEWAINTYMIKNHKKVYWMHFSIHNIWRHRKYGFWEGCKTYITATLANARVGLPTLLWQTLFFCRDEAPN